MAVTIEVKENNYSLPPVGLVQAVCCELVHLGFRQTSFKDTDGTEKQRTVNEYQYYFQLNKVDQETGKRYEIRSKALNATFGEKADLRKFLLQWRGHDLTEAEKKPPGVDIDLVGKNAMISVVHAKVGEKTYANIGSITPLMEGLPEIQALNYEPKQAKIDAAKAAAANGNAAGAVPVSQPSAPKLDSVNDHIPF